MEALCSKVSIQFLFSRETWNIAQMSKMCKSIHWYCIHTRGTHSLNYFLIPVLNMDSVPLKLIISFKIVPTFWVNIKARLTCIVSKTVATESSHIKNTKVKLVRKWCFKLELKANSKNVRISCVRIILYNITTSNVDQR